MIDSDGDGFLSEADIQAIVAATGLEFSDTEIEQMLATAPGHINFTMFLTLMGEKSAAASSVAGKFDIFETFDETKSGRVRLKDFGAANQALDDIFGCTAEELQMLQKDELVQDELS